MQIALNGQNFRALSVLPLALQHKAVYVWQLAEIAWRRPQAIEVLDHLLCLAHAVTHVYVLTAGSKGATVVSHTVYDPATAGLDRGAYWPSIVASSIGWARDVVLTAELAGDEPWRSEVLLFDFWAYSRTDYETLHLRE